MQAATSQPNTAPPASPAPATDPGTSPEPEPGAAQPPFRPPEWSEGGGQDFPGLLQKAAESRLLKPLREVGVALWSKTRGTVRVDLVRPTFPAYEGSNNVLVAKRPERHNRRQPQRRAGFFTTPPHEANGRLLYDGEDDADHRGGWVGGSFSRLHTLRRTGARFKILRHVDVGPQLKEGTAEPGQRLFDCAAGVNYEMDSSSLQPIARLKFMNAFSLKLLPRPIFKFQRSWDLRLKGLALRCAYECPLESLDTFWAPPARLMVRLDNAAGTGVHFADGGLELDERIRSGGTVLRAAGGIKFPRQLPIEPDKGIFSFFVRRLGLKTQW